MEFSFTWIFVLLVGAAILAIAVFASFRFVDSGQVQYNSQVAAQLGAILSPLETGVESGKAYELGLPSESRLSAKCDDRGTFGFEEISVSVRSGIGTEWQKNGVPYKLSNKFVFVEPNLQGKSLHVFSAPIELPYKTGDLILLYSKSYCLVDAPSDVEDDLTFLQMASMKIAKSVKSCPVGSVSVCFGSSSGCDVGVSVDSTNENRGEVVKAGKRLPYVGQMLYAAIVSEPIEYECQITRIRKRTAELSDLYNTKTNFLATRGCNNLLGAGLNSYRTDLLNKNVGFVQILNEAEELKRENDRLICRLF